MLASIIYPKDLDRNLSYPEARAILEKELEANKGRQLREIEQLPLDRIFLATAVFQPRLLNGWEVSRSADHVESLLEAIKSSPHHTLDPIVVWWSGKCFRVIDGHHRLEAYRRAAKQPKLRVEAIPVIVFEGTLERAIAEAIRSNAKDKLSMTQEDKLNAAWRMSIDGGVSRKDVWKFTGASTGSVSAMRRKISELKKLYPTSWQDVARSQTWQEARAGDRVSTADYDDAWLREAIKSGIQKLRKEFPRGKLLKNRELAYQIFKGYSPNLVGNIASDFFMENPDKLDELKEWDEDSDF